MKIILQLVFIVNCLDSLIAQTYISPTIGYDFANMHTDPDDISYYNIEENKYAVKNLVVGLKIKQKVASKIDIVVSSMYSQKTANGGIAIIIAPVGGIKFDYFQNGIQCNYNHRSYFCALGANYNLLTNFRYKRNGKEFLDKISEKGLRVAVGKYYKHFCAEAYFYKGLTANLDNNKIRLLPIESFGILASYDIKIFDKFKRKTKAACPKF